jgi:hypothetical protein
MRKAQTRFMFGDYRAGLAGAGKLKKRQWAEPNSSYGATFHVTLASHWDDRA